MMGKPDETRMTVNDIVTCLHTLTGFNHDQAVTWEQTYQTNAINKTIGVIEEYATDLIYWLTKKNNIYNYENCRLIDIRYMCERIIEYVNNYISEDR